MYTEPTESMKNSLSQFSMPNPCTVRQRLVAHRSCQLPKRTENLSQAAVRQGAIIVVTGRVYTRFSRFCTLSGSISLSKGKLTLGDIRCQVSLKPPHALLQCGAKMPLVQNQRLSFAPKYGQDLGS